MKVVQLVADPLVDPTPDLPAGTLAAWTTFAFVRKELESMAIRRALGDDTATSISSESGANRAAAADAADAPNGKDESVTTDKAVAADPDWDAAFTGEPSLVTRGLVAGLRVVTSVGRFFGIDVFTTFARLASSTSPPRILTLGLQVDRSEFEGIPVWTLTPAHPSGKQVVAIHGGAFAIEATVIHWLDYSWMARATGVTIIVPIYPLAPTPAGTAANVVPKIADLISAEIDQHGAENVSVYGDSAGGTLGLAAAQELVRRGDPVPAAMVLLSPGIDLTFTNPNIELVHDPVLGGPAVQAELLSWAGDLDLTDPLVSPLYGSLEGLPPTWIYSGSLDMLAPDVAVLNDRAVAEGTDNLNFVLRKGLIHDWALPLSPEGFGVRGDIYRQLRL